MKKLITLLLALFILVGCFSKKEEKDDVVVLVSSDDKNYDYVLPFETNHLRFARPGVDYIDIGKGLIEISKDYFSLSTNSMKEGSIISSYSDDYRPLVMIRESNDNPVGLNPHRDTEILVNKTDKLKGPIFVSDLFEIDFVSSKNTSEITGASFALVLNKTLYDENNRLITIDDDVLYEFATKIAGPKLESFLRKKPQLAQVPIVIGIYVIDRSNTSISGTYLAQAKFENRQGNFEKINHIKTIFPTNSGKAVDLITNEQILSLKRSLNGFLPEDIGIVAYGEYYDDKLDNLKININVQTKTYTEIAALSYYVGELITSFDNQSKIIVEVTSLNETLAIIKKAANSDNVEVIIL